MGTRSNYLIISNISLVMSIIILIIDAIAILSRIEINRTTLVMSIILGILLFFNGILYKKKVKPKKPYFKPQ